MTDQKTPAGTEDLGLSGAVRRLWQRVEANPPPGPFRERAWRSPLRGPWLTSVFGAVLLVGVPVVFLTGLASYAAYNPDLPGNDTTPGRGLLGFYLFTWPTSPVWLYRLTQGVHVTLALVLVPILLAKLWSVIPRFFAWPPVRSPAQALERATLLLLVGGAIFEFATGILNIQLWYVFPGSFYSLHLYGAWVFVGALVSHVAIKLPTMRAALRSRSWREELTVDTAGTRPEPPDPSGLVATDPAPATMSRRGALALVGGGSLTVLALSVGQSLGGPWRRTALLAPRGQVVGDGLAGFQVNKTAEEVAVVDAAMSPSWQLELRGPDGAVTTLDRAALLAMPQHTAWLPIACVEGWSTRNQEWTGVRLRDLAAAVGVESPGTARVESLQRGGAFRAASLAANQVADDDSLLALRVGGQDLSLDHGFPARVIMPAAPGVHNTKWVSTMTFEA